MITYFISFARIGVHAEVPKMFSAKSVNISFLSSD